MDRLLISEAAENGEPGRVKLSGSFTIPKNDLQSDERGQIAHTHTTGFQYNIDHV